MTELNASGAFEKRKHNETMTIKSTNPAAALLKLRVKVSSTMRLLISNRIILKQVVSRLQTATPTNTEA